ncbi:hormogonium polysaccharide biosynthesis protein HpsA [Planktothrix agardhii]|uniref:hormogonium polysaccharide biosynthesis protein HpsA n=1 Tax=Planktothrix agardhii TaxID=1160 RepID=UPI001D0BE062|nr:hormogonium polysaccharide biosynthesis protein HpsA [Planktothrix agardhii]MCB8757905.1 hormogonium polysaccharide biosynthesis protein HpsA [Planktothrix agardhii 1813]
MSQYQNKRNNPILFLGRRIHLMFKQLMRLMMRSLLRRWFILSHHDRYAKAGFVLPTVAMVLLVVVLLSLAITFRAFDRAKYAQNTRVDQQVLSLATPALERAKVKLEKAFGEFTETPSELGLLGELTKPTPQGSTKKFKYEFKDENTLTLAFDQETLNTAWKFPVDLDNDGKTDGPQDGFNLYGIFFRSPERDDKGKFKEVRTPLEARSYPLPKLTSAAVTNKDCPQSLGTSASLVGSSDWYKVGANLKKSFFIYAATIPKQGSGFSALEIQQDRERIPLVNNAVVYEDDLQITPGASGIQINGRIFTNANLLTGKRSTGGAVEYYQVSSPKSCFYEMENSKIVVGGNVGIGAPDSNTALEAVQVHLFKSGSAPTNKPSMSSAEQPVTESAKDISYNDKRYVDRIASLRDAQMAIADTKTDPQEVQDDVADGIGREKALENYFRARTRRVPTVDKQTDTPLPVPPESGNTLRPPNTHAFPYAPPDNSDGKDYNGTTLNGTAPTLMPPATEPSLVKNNQKETRLGDRIAMGNGLPAKWFNNNDFTSSDTQLIKNIKDYEWDEGTPAPRYRKTQMQDLADFGSTQRNGFWEQAAAKAPSDTDKGVGGLRIVTGAGIYGRANSTSFLPEPPTAPNNPITSEDESQFDVVWPDTMPMWQDTADPSDPSSIPDGKPDIGAPSPQLDKQGDLKMRATVVYHYIQDPWNPDAVPADKRQSPLACISSYYDPTTEKTAMNRAGLPNIKLRETDRTLAWGTTNTVATANQGNSHNGVVYSMSSTAIAQATPGANGLFTLTDPKAKDPTDSTADFKQKIIYQANLVFPDGRFVNEPLRKALEKAPDGRSLDEQSAIDTTLCAMTILNNLGGNPNDKPGAGDTVIPHGAIYETAFLDSRQIKSIENNDKTPDTYDRPIEDRQPLEIRATVIDLDLLRRGTVGSSEYLLPNSGIIYATREDALLDQSDNDTTSWDLRSPVDYILDETRRPNGIMLINGQILARGGNTNDYNDIEKGLILATDLPAYVKADSSNGFNLHQSTPGGAQLEEFDTTALTGTPKKWTETSFYGRTKLNKSFACRKGDTRLECDGNGDLWRPATVISDAITLLSNSFKTGYRNLGDYDLRNNTVLSVDYITHKGLNPIIAGSYDNSNNPVKGYDLNNNGNLNDSFSEVTLKLDLNGDGDQTDTSVSEKVVTVAAARQFNGFYDNNYVTTTDWYKTDGKPEATKVNSYMNNFITPVQLRGSAPEYVMEICRKPLVSMCKPEDWVIGIDDVNVNQKFDSGEEELSYDIPVDTAVGQLLSGTTARPALDLNDRIYPRRIAFARDSSNKLILDSANLPIALGIYNGQVDYAGNGTAFTFQIPGFVNNGKSVKTTVPTSATNALRFQQDTNKPPKLDWNPGKSLAQPIWKPLVQLNQIALFSNNDGWQQPATASKFNLIIASGDAPTRVDPKNEKNNETNGGLPNFARFIENWTGKEAQISGSFIQFKRSAYATGPFMPISSIIDRTNPKLTKFGNPPSNDPRPYRADNNDGRTAQYMPPNRVYGFDVALLSQSPDLFAAKFTLPSTQPPDQYFREVGKDDPWIQTLLCAAQDTNSNYGPAPTDYGTGKFYALPENLRPKNCPLGE